jgi:hypothetical protein
MVSDEQWMQAVSGNDTVAVGAQLSDLQPAGSVHRRHYKGFDPRGASTVEYLCPVGVECGVIQVNVAVDKHACV